MEITLTEHPGYQLIAVSGRLDASSAPELMASFDSAFAPDKARFVLDLGEVDYVSSGGLRAILQMTKKVRGAGGGIVLAQLQPFVEDLIHMSGFDNLIAAAETTEQAAGLLPGGTP